MMLWIVLLFPTLLGLAVGLIIWAKRKGYGRDPDYYWKLIKKSEEVDDYWDEDDEKS